MSVILNVASAPPPRPTGPNYETLVSVTQDLIAVIEREIATLTAEGDRDITPFQDEKNRLAQIYAREMALVRACPNQVAHWPTEALEHLKGLTQQFHAVLRTHLTTLDRVRGVTETVLNAIGKHVSDRTRPVIGYGKDATARQANARQPVSLAYDQAI